MQTDIKKNIGEILEKINTSVSNSEQTGKEVLLVAVSKRKSLEHIKAAIQSGILHFGENYAQELKEKNIQISSNNIKWHFIGPLQSNKVKLVANYASWIHTLDRKKIIYKLNDACKESNNVINGLIQVNVSEEPTKSGCSPSELLNLAGIVDASSNINLKGIMALPNINADSQNQTKEMKQMYEYSLKVQAKYPEAKEISLGTTNDFQNAIEHGSSIVRIGESIFGKRL